MIILGIDPGSRATGYGVIEIGDASRVIDYGVVKPEVGSGQALRLGEAGDADVLLVHAPDLEMEFVRSGNGLYRQPVMYNGFVIVGPRDDPAGLA